MTLYLQWMHRGEKLTLTIPWSCGWKIPQKTSVQLWSMHTILPIISTILATDDSRQRTELWHLFIGIHNHGEFNRLYPSLHSTADVPGLRRSSLRHMSMPSGCSWVITDSGKRTSFVFMIFCKSWYINNDHNTCHYIVPISLLLVLQIKVRWSTIVIG